nr:DHHW family protein [uncultured Agathobaculum sp.]
MKHFFKIILFCGALFLVSAQTLLKEPATTSYYENRALAVFPPFSMQEVLDGEYFPQVETWIDDHLAWRDSLLEYNTRKELALHNPVVNDTVVTQDILLPYHGTVLDHYDETKMAQELDMLQELDSYCTQKGIEFLYVGIPEQSNAFRDRYPSYLNDSSYRDDTMRTDFMAGVEARGIDHLWMAQYLSADYDKYYSKTDHHYNLYGAYETYLRIMAYLNANGVAAPVTTDLTITPVDTDFLGSRNRKLLGLFETDDQLYTGTLAEPVPFTRTDNGKPVEATVYSEANRNVYAYYMGGDIAETIIQTNRPELPDVLVVGDSFTNALESILYTSFDEMRSLDYRYYTAMSIYDYLENWQPDAIIYVRDDLSYISTDGNGDLQ